MMTVINAGKDGSVVHTKGAPDELLKICTHIYDGSTVLPRQKKMPPAYKRPTGNGKQSPAGDRRAYKPHRQDEEPEEKLIFTGLVGMIDPPRPEAYAAVKNAKTPE